MLWRGWSVVDVKRAFAAARRALGASVLGLTLPELEAPVVPTFASTSAEDDASYTESEREEEEEVKPTTSRQPATTTHGTRFMSVAVFAERRTD